MCAPGISVRWSLCGPKMQSSKDSRCFQLGGTNRCRSVVLEVSACACMLGALRWVGGAMLGALRWVGGALCGLRPVFVQCRFLRTWQ